MAQLYKNDKGFLVIEMNHKEATEICNFGCIINNTEHHIVCDNCNNLIDKKDNIYYFAVLNRAFCKECTDDIIANIDRELDDISYEERHYNYYANKLGIESIK